MNSDPRRSVKLPAALCDAWIYQWAYDLFRDAHPSDQPLFRSPSDLLALSGAVRALAWSGTIGRTIDAGEGVLVIHTFTQPIPWSAALGTHVPHIDDAFHLLGERSRARFKDIMVSRPQYRMPWDFISNINYLADTKKGPSEWLSRCAFRWLRGGTCFEPRLVRPLPSAEAAVLSPALDHLNVPFVPREHPHPDRAPNWWNASFGRLAAQGSPEWRQKLVRFCRNAVRHLGVRGRGVDPLPIAFDETDTFEHLADLLINRANQMIRHSGSGPAGPDLDWASLAPPLFWWQFDQGASNTPDAPSASAKSIQQTSEQDSGGSPPEPNTPLITLEALVTALGLSNTKTNAVDAMLRRLVEQNPSYRANIENPRKGEPRFMYRTAFVWPHLLDALPRWR